ncbi:MAG: gliding motility-associated C-terminal domain-containing protein [Bacteroidia bacterium]|nr:gliding motility-associated C-terminal domain-containing protein [Bacteroidia bacterium]
MKALICIGGLVCAQSFVTNTGVPLYLEPGGIIWCEGGWDNQTGGTFLNQGTVYIAGDIQNGDAGQFFPPAPFPGTLVLNGTVQSLGGPFPIRTDTLRLQNTAPKILFTDLFIDRLLDLGDSELRTQSRFAAVRSAEPGAILRQTGFVSSESGGYLERATDRSAVYLFPVGGTTPFRYRPVELIPSSSAPHRFAARLANGDPTLEGRPRDQLHHSLCEINPLYDHYINRLAGSDPVELRVYYAVGDPVTGPLAQWKNVLWNPTPATPIPSGWSLSGWSDFTDPYFAFSERRIQVSLTASADTVQVGQVLTLSASSQPNSPTYLWNLGDGTTQSGGALQNHSYSQPGTYTVAVSTPPCSDTTYKRIVVVAPALLSVPNSFSPNGDGINDFWRVEIVGQIRSLRWNIYDRWGILLFSGEGTSARWDGTKNGQPCAEGAYVYVIEAETFLGEKFIRTGTLTLLR